MFYKSGLVKRVPGLAGSNLMKCKSISVDLKHVQTIFSNQICLTLRVREVPGSIPIQGPRHTKDVIKMVPVVPLFGTQH